MIDVLVIGAGGAGLVAALNAKESGASVIVANKSYPTRAQTCMAQGGINAALLHVEHDSVESHISDTIKASQGLADEKMVTLLCEKAPEAINWLDRVGVPFSRDSHDYIAQRRLGGASAPRACYAQDFSGLKILHTLYDQCLKNDITFKNEYFLLNLISYHDEDGELVIGGATFLELKTGEVKSIEAKSVILATGGYAKIYQKHSTNSSATTGDGLSAALRAGASLSDLEFIQFHPTALKNSSILISESARGAGGHLLTKEHKRFTDELAPRDVVARAIYEEIEHGSGEVFLDIRHLGEEFIDEELPQERKLAKLYENIDPVHELIPIKPAAHYSMGGIRVDNQSMSSIKGLFACGEVANHRVHGANRLGGNSLLELIVFGREAGVNASKYSKELSSTCKEHEEALSHQLSEDNNFIHGIKQFTKQIDFYEKREFIGNIFYNNIGIKRDDMSMKAVLGAIRQIQKEIPFMGPKDISKIYNTNLMEFIEFGNMIELSELIVVSAISRNESRGAHYRSDAPKRLDDVYGAHTITWRDQGILCADFMQ